MNPYATGNWLHPDGYYVYTRTGDGYLSISGGYQPEYGATGQMRKLAYVDIGNCLVSNDRYLTGDGYQYAPNDKFVLLSATSDSEDYYVVPASQMSNGLDGQ